MWIWLGIVGFILWTVVILIAGYWAGKTDAEEEAVESASTYNSYSYSTGGPELSGEEIDTIVNRVLHQIELEPDDISECNFTTQKQELFKELWEEYQKRQEHGSVDGRMRAIEDRVKRVERKTGMSV